MTLGPTTRVGVAASASARPSGLAPIEAAADMVGTLRINAILMTILPLVVSKLVVSVAGQKDGRAHGRAGRRAVFAPVPTAAGLPVEAMGVLLAVDPIPKAFRTVANVTGMLASTVLADGRRQTAHSSERPGEEQP